MVAAGFEELHNAGISIVKDNARVMATGTDLLKDALLNKPEIDRR